MLPRLIFFSQENNKSLGWYHAFLGQINAINHNCEDISVAGLSGLIAFPHLFLVFVFVVLLLFWIWDEHFVFCRTTNFLHILEVFWNKL